MTTEQVKALVTALRDIVAVRADADPVGRAAVYNDFGVALTYTPDGSVGVQAHRRGVQVRVGGPGELVADWRLRPWQNGGHQP